MKYFEIGDKVRVIDTCTNSAKVGDIVVVCDMEKTGDRYKGYEYLVHFNDLENCSMHQKRFELVEKAITGKREQLLSKIEELQQELAAHDAQQAKAEALKKLTADVEAAKNVLDKANEALSKFQGE